MSRLRRGLRASRLRGGQRVRSPSHIAPPPATSALCCCLSDQLMTNLDTGLAFCLFEFSTLSLLCGTGLRVCRWLESCSWE